MDREYTGKKWKFENCEVYQFVFDHDLMGYEICKPNGTIDTVVNEYEDLERELDTGNGPIDDGWTNSSGETISDRSYDTYDVYVASNDRIYQLVLPQTEGEIWDGISLYDKIWKTDLYNRIETDMIIGVNCSGYSNAIKIECGETIE
ncbi:MAG: hypothetical protein WCR24_07520 [Candidatus Methanomethylophilaceae archaeon]